MLSISDKGNSMPESPIRKLVPYAEQAKQDGKHVFHLNIGQPDIETSEIALEAIRNLREKVIEYSHSAGIESYRKGLVGYYANNGIEISHQDIIITTGGSEALLFGFMGHHSVGHGYFSRRDSGELGRSGDYAGGWPQKSIA